MRDKQTQKKSERRKIKNREKKIEQIHYPLLIFAMIFCVINLGFFESKTIGGDYRYVIYIFLLPIIIGMLFFGIYRKEFLVRKFISFKEIHFKIYVICFYFLQGVLISYLSFGQVTSVIWNYINVNEAERNPAEVVICKVTSFYTNRNPHISFDFKGQTETFDVSSEMNKEIYNRDPKNYELEITIQKGIWNYFIVKHWKLKRIH
ncbi:hypothetical protein [Flavobacterium sp. CECT 9288]|uniref:hypothetical protein n=1 Tax=Flavobacterium sp. CECT 9288 TaxID=2845819 RepID=UPI001E645E84|nr:hypothetical protein [Flavobacterium sp. CECT 9288]